MKNKPTISEIAEKLCVSKSTVSKVLNNKPGIAKETRAKILEYASVRGYRFPDADKTDIVIIIPDIYKNLCSYIQKQCKNLNLVARCGVYKREEDFLLAIKGLKKVKPKIVAIYPMHTEKAPEELKRLMRWSLVWFIGDFINLENTFYFGSNPISDATELGNCFLDSGCTRPLFIHSKNSIINTIKTRAFAKSLAEKGIYPVGQLFCKKNSPSMLARTIEMRVRASFDSVYFGDDLADFAKVTLSKLSKEDVKIFKYETEEFEIHILKMLDCAKEYIEKRNFPENKYNF